MSDYEKSWDRIEKLHRQLDIGQAVSDDELIQAATSLKIVTNAGYAAFLLFKAIAPICGYRRHLTDKLLFEPMLPLHYLGANEAQEVISWLNHHLTQANPFDGIGQVAIDWIKWLGTQPDLIQKHLDNEIAKNDEYFIQSFRKELVPYSKLKEEFITFQIRWKDRLLDSVGAIIFFCFASEEDDSDPHLDFESLTEVIAKVDINHLIKFYACNIETWWDFLEQMKDPLVAQKFPKIEKNRIQTIWIFEGSILYTAEPSQKSQDVYLANTLELLTLIKE
jgi:hypothetical protein